MHWRRDRKLLQTCTITLRFWATNIPERIVNNRLRPSTPHDWLYGVLGLGSLALLISGGVLTSRAYLWSAGAVHDYLPGVGGLVAGVFGVALAEILSILHQLYRRVAEVEASSRERVAETEARVLACLSSPAGARADARGQHVESSSP